MDDKVFDIHTAMNLPEVESERGPWQNFHTMAHHGHLVQCWLTIEDHQIIIHNVPLHLDVIGIKKHIQNCHL